MNILQTTNYPTSFLEGTFGDKFYKNVVEPAKMGTGAKPTLGQVVKNWNPIKAFMPKSMGGTFYTKGTPAALNFLKGSGIVGAGVTAATTGAQLGDWAYKNIDPVTEFGDWVGGGIYDLIHGRQIKAREQLMNQRIMNRRKQQMQKTIRQAEAAEAAKKKKITTGGPPSITQKKNVITTGGPPSITQKKKKKWTPPHQTGGGGNIHGGGQKSSKTSAPQRDYSKHSAYGLKQGGLVQLLRYGGMVDG